jgi:copper chaperone CopZ
MTTVIYNVANISCHHCVHTIQSEVGELAGVKTVNAEVASKRVVVVYEPPATPETIKALLSEINYPVTSEVMTAG